jgi:hypothetical protein
MIQCSHDALGSLVHYHRFVCPPLSCHADLLLFVDWSLELIKDMMIGMVEIPRSQVLMSSLHQMFPMVV